MGTFRLVLSLIPLAFVCLFGALAWLAFQLYALVGGSEARRQFARKLRRQIIRQWEEL